MNKIIAVILIVLLGIINVQLVSAVGCVEITQEMVQGNIPHNQLSTSPSPRLVSVDKPWGNEWWFPITTERCYEVKNNIETYYPIRVINPLPPEYFPSGTDANGRLLNPLKFICGTETTKKSITYYGSSNEIMPDDDSQLYSTGDPVNDLDKAPVLILDGYIDASNCKLIGGGTGLQMLGHSTATYFEVTNPEYYGAILSDYAYIASTEINGPYQLSDITTKTSLLQTGNSQSAQMLIKGVRYFDGNRWNLFNQDKFLGNGIELHDYSTTINSQVLYAQNSGVMLKDNTKATSIIVRDARIGFDLESNAVLDSSEVYEHRQVGVRAIGNSKITNVKARDSKCNLELWGIPNNCLTESINSISDGYYPTRGFQLSGTAVISNSIAEKNGIGFLVSDNYGPYEQVQLVNSKAIDNRHYGFYIQSGPALLTGLTALGNSQDIYGREYALSSLRIGDSKNQANGVIAKNIYMFDNYGTGIISDSNLGEFSNTYSCNNRITAGSNYFAEIRILYPDVVIKGNVFTTYGSMDISAPEQSLLTAIISDNCPEEPPTGDRDPGTKYIPTVATEDNQ